MNIPAFLITVSVALIVTIVFLNKKMKMDKYCICLELPTKKGGDWIIQYFYGYLNIGGYTHSSEEAWSLLLEGHELHVKGYAFLLTGHDLWISNEPQPGIDSRTLLMGFYDRVEEQIARWEDSLVSGAENILEGGQ